jgi:hypothetical protein
MDILQGLTEHRQSPHWADALRSIHSAWFVIYQELTRKWDRSRYIESCRTNISRNWEFALPILKDLRGQKAFDEAIPVIETAVRALLHLRDSEMWDPREELLIAHPAMMHRTEVAPSPVPLLEGWRKVAEALGQDEIATALKLQVITYRRWADWDVVLSAFRQVASPRLASLADRLFASWKSLIVDRTLGGRYVEHELSEMSWVHSLVDAARAGTGGKTMFRLAVRHWLEDVEAKPDALEPSREALAVLTLDLDEKSELRRLSPTLKRLISSPDWSARSTLRTSRRRRLHMLKPTSLFTDIIGLWRRNVHRLVPDPAQEVNSNYERSADWLAAVLELNTRSYKKIVSEWAVTHRRRRNLWKALAKKNLPLSEKP